MAVGTTAVPFIVLHIESGAGGDELLDHERVDPRRGTDKRSAPAEMSVATLNGVWPMQSAQWPYPSLPWTSSPAPAAMSCSTTGVWPFIAAKMSAVLLPRSLLPGLNSAKPSQSAQGPYPSLNFTLSPAPAAMSCSTTAVWPSNAAEMSAVSLPRGQLPG